jgi:two-component SAPR family response regulator
MVDSKLKQLIEKRNTVNARIKQEQNKLKTGERKSDTRRKVLAGAAVLQWAKQDTEFSSRLMTELKAFLVRDDDRALFGLPPLPKAKEHSGS